jgi:hypothetical protein
VWNRPLLYPRKWCAEVQKTDSARDQAWQQFQETGLQPHTYPTNNETRNSHCKRVLYLTAVVAMCYRIPFTKEKQVGHGTDNNKANAYKVFKFIQVDCFGK